MKDLTLQFMLTRDEWAALRYALTRFLQRERTSIRRIRERGPVNPESHYWRERLGRIPHLEALLRRLPEDWIVEPNVGSADAWGVPPGFWPDEPVVSAGDPKAYREAAQQRTGKLPSEAELRKRFRHVIMYGNGDFIAMNQEPERTEIRADREPEKPVTARLEKGWPTAYESGPDAWNSERYRKDWRGPRHGGKMSDMLNQISHAREQGWPRLPELFDATAVLRAYRPKTDLEIRSWENVIDGDGNPVPFSRAREFLELHPELKAMLDEEAQALGFRGVVIVDPEPGDE